MVSVKCAMEGPEEFVASQQLPPPRLQSVFSHLCAELSLFIYK